jgi:hypothetical protein
MAGFKPAAFSVFATPARKWCPCGDSNTDCPRFEGGDSYRLVCMGVVRAEGFEPATVLLLRQSPPTVGLRAQWSRLDESNARTLLTRQDLCH